MLDARLSKIERAMDGTEGDGQSFENLLCSIRCRLVETIENPNTAPAACADAREKLSHLEAEVWSFRLGEEQKRMNIIDALREGRLAGGRIASRVVDPKKGDGEGPDWGEVAEGLGLPVSPYTGPPLLVTRLIVSPPDNLLTLHSSRLGNGSSDESRH